MITQPLLGFIGAGNMAQALIAGWVSKGQSASSILISDANPQKLSQLKKKYGVLPVSSNQELVQKASQIVLAVKPQDLRQVLSEIVPFVKNQTFVSIAAGIDLSFISRHLTSPSQKKAPLVLRAMPNNPALIGQGITALYTPLKLNSSQKKNIQNIFLGAGQVLWVEKEKDLDAVTGLSGSGPAYVYLFTEALIQAGIARGLSLEIASQLVISTLVGSSLMIQKTMQKPEELIAQVTSKRGTTLAGLQVLKKGGLFRLIKKTVRAATLRAQQMRKEFGS